ncbi:hypothetical protein HME9304_00924 [Flagellimonas maritima]|uniref:Uncharacterized protein n=1 Tax=Flagellimonas maritima TaxID=1383885 RepID=A0A2Z4LQ46_9FLAO|nr:hypothetical protein HME9304_00924 [Allomuricauda aurantiaca]
MKASKKNFQIFLYLLIGYEIKITESFISYQEKNQTEI